MQRLLSDEQVKQIWELAREQDIAPNADVTLDRNGDPFTVFDSWEDVEAIAEIINVTFPEFAQENTPSWEHLPEKKRPNPYHHIEWAIGEYGFSDQFQTCSHCMVAIDTQDSWPYYYWNEDTSEIICGDCLKSDPDWASEYLSYCAARLRTNAECVYSYMVDPDKCGFVCLNEYSSDYYVPSDTTDHPAYDRRLDYAKHEELIRLGKAAHIIDPNLEIVYTYRHSSSVVLWARFNPNQSYDFALCSGGRWYSYDLNSGDVEIELNVINPALGYAIGRMFAKFGQLTNKGSK